MALTTLADFRLQTGIGTGAASDAMVSALLNVVSDQIKTVCHRDFEVETLTEYYSGENDPYLILRQRPIISVTRVCIDSLGWFGQNPNGFPSGQDLVQGTDFSIMYGAKGLGSNGTLLRIQGSWPRPQAWKYGRVAPQPRPQTGNIMVVYQAGYSVIPAGLSGLINQAIARAINNAALGGPVAASAYEDASVSWFSPADLVEIFGSVERQIGAYKEFVV